MNGCIYPRSVPRCYPPEVQQECLHPRTSPSPGPRTSRTPSLGSRKSSLSNHSSRLSSCSSRSCSPRPRLRRETAQVFFGTIVKRLIDRCIIIHIIIFRILRTVTLVQTSTSSWLISIRNAAEGGCS